MAKFKLVVHVYEVHTLNQQVEIEAESLERAAEIALAQNVELTRDVAPADPAFRGIIMGRDTDETRDVQVYEDLGEGTFDDDVVLAEYVD